MDSKTASFRGPGESSSALQGSAIPEFCGFPPPKHQMGNTEVDENMWRWVTIPEGEPPNFVADLFEMMRTDETLKHKIALCIQKSAGNSSGNARSSRSENDLGIGAGILQIQSTLRVPALQDSYSRQGATSMSSLMPPQHPSRNTDLVHHRRRSDASTDLTAELKPLVQEAWNSHFSSYTVSEKAKALKNGESLPGTEWDLRRQFTERTMAVAKHSRVLYELYHGPVISTTNVAKTFKTTRPVLQAVERAVRELETFCKNKGTTPAPSATEGSVPSELPPPKDWKDVYLYDQFVYPNLETAPKTRLWGKRKASGASVSRTTASSSGMADFGLTDLGQGMIDFHKGALSNGVDYQHLKSAFATLFQGISKCKNYHEGLLLHSEPQSPGGEESKARKSKDTRLSNLRIDYVSFMSDTHDEAPSSSTYLQPPPRYPGYSHPDSDSKHDGSLSVESDHGGRSGSDVTERNFHTPDSCED